MLFPTSSLNEKAGIKPPTYHRQRLLLFMLEQAGGTLGRLDLQKLLFLYVQESGTKHYAFVPYRFGCYSFLAADDLDLLHKRDWIFLADNEITLKRPLSGQKWATGSEERQTVRRWLSRHSKRGTELIRDVYRLYPWYAIQSEIKENILNSDELERVHQAKASEAQPDQTLFTLGYEGIHFETYVNKLIRNNIKLLCDVRRNPLSRKFGFSQRSLSTLLPKWAFNISTCLNWASNRRAASNLTACVIMRRCLQNIGAHCQREHPA